MSKNFARTLTAGFLDPQVQKTIRRLTTDKAFIIGDGTPVCLDDMVRVPTAVGGRRADSWGRVVLLDPAGLGLRFTEKVGRVRKEFFEWDELAEAHVSGISRTGLKGQRLRRRFVTPPVILGARRAALRALWNAPGRVYHDTGHLDALLALFAQHRDQVRDPVSFELAIYYHDAVLVAGAKDNETRSVVLMHHEQKDRLPLAALERAGTLIMATAGHHVPPHLPDDLAADIALFLDIDLAVLGTPAAEYDTYAAGIAAEHAQYSPAIYRAGRRRVLKRLLARDQLFLTPAFVVLEARALNNMERELAALHDEERED